MSMCALTSSPRPGPGRETDLMQALGPWGGNVAFEYNFEIGGGPGRKHKFESEWKV